jgi:predicted RNA-binding protein YlxR (DUF448 family)
MVKTKNSFTKIRCLKRAISKKELLRIVYNKAGEISIDPTGKQLGAVLISPLKTMKQNKPSKNGYSIVCFRRKLRIVFMTS